MRRTQTLDAQNEALNVQQNQPTNTPPETSAAQKTNYTSPENILREWKRVSVFAKIQKVLQVILSIFTVLTLLPFATAIALTALPASLNIGELGMLGTLAPIVFFTAFAYFSISFWMLLLMYIGSFILGRWTLKQDIDYVSLNHCATFNDRVEKRNFQSVTSAILLAQKPAYIVLVVGILIQAVISDIVTALMFAISFPALSRFINQLIEYKTGTPDPLSIFVIVLTIIVHVILGVLGAVLNACAKMNVAQKAAEATAKAAEATAKAAEAAANETEATANETEAAANETEATANAETPAE